MTVNIDKLYQGVTFPLVERPTGLFGLSGTKEVIQASIRMILLTVIGERVMLPEFGSRLWELVGEQNDLILENLAKLYTIDAVRRWENRVVLKSVETGAHEHEFSIRALYMLKATKQDDHLVLNFPRQLV